MTPAQSAAEEEQREVIRVALNQWYARDPNARHYQWGLAKRMLALGAYLDAVLVMMPEGWFGSVPINRRCDAWIRQTNESPIVYGAGPTPALALLAAIQACHADPA